MKPKISILILVAVLVAAMLASACAGSFQVDPKTDVLHIAYCHVGPGNIPHYYFVTLYPKPFCPFDYFRKLENYWDFLDRFSHWEYIE